MTTTSDPCPNCGRTRWEIRTHASVTRCGNCGAVLAPDGSTCPPTGPSLNITERNIDPRTTSGEVLLRGEEYSFWQAVYLESFKAEVGTASSYHAQRADKAIESFRIRRGARMTPEQMHDAIILRTYKKGV